MKSELPGAIPEIPVSNIEEAIVYYQIILGFALDWDGGDLGLAGISRGNCRLFLADQNYRNGYGSNGPAMTWLNLDSKDQVDELYRTWKSSGAKLKSAPESKTWGLHEFSALDLDGNVFRVFFDFATADKASEAIST